MTHLLDANALIALGWPTHEHHRHMLGWFRTHARDGWATSALTQGAFVRIVSQQVFAGRAIAVGEVAELLLRNTASAASAHRFGLRLRGSDEGLHGRYSRSSTNYGCLAADCGTPDIFISYSRDDHPVAGGAPMP